MNKGKRKEGREKKRMKGEAEKEIRKNGRDKRRRRIDIWRNFPFLKEGGKEGYGKRSSDKWGIRRSGRNGEKGKEVERKGREKENRARVK